MFIYASAPQQAEIPKGTVRENRPYFYAPASARGPVSQTKKMMFHARNQQNKRNFVAK